MCMEDLKGQEHQTGFSGAEQAAEFLEDGVHPSLQESKEVELEPYEFETLEEAWAKINLEEVGAPESHDPEVRVIRCFADYLISSGQVTGPQAKKMREAEIAQKKERIQEEIAEKCWWLQPEWQEALSDGRLSEQISLQVGDQNVEVYNFTSDGLSEDQIAAITRGLVRLAGVNKGELLESFPHILVTPQIDVPQEVIDRVEAVGMKDKVPKGRAHFDSGYIEIASAGLTLEPARGGEIEDVIVPKLEYIVMHEYGHFHERSNLVGSEWEKQIGWKYKGGKYELAEESIPGPTLYSRTNPREDFAESFTLALSGSSQLQGSRRDFVAGSMEGSASPAGGYGVQVTKKQGSEIMLPSLDRQTVKYAVVESDDVL